MIHAKNGEVYVKGCGIDLMSEFATIVGALATNGIPASVIRETVDIGLKYKDHPDVKTVKDPFGAKDSENIDAFERIFGQYFRD